MKIVVISDSHRNIANLKHVMGFAKKINASAIIHCGDWNSVEAIRTVTEYKIPLYSVLGNADIDPEIEKRPSKQSKKFTQNFLKLKLDGKNVGVIHNLDHLVSNIQPLNILFYGHTHKQMDKMVGMVRMVNPGALEHEIEFAVYDTETSKVEFIHE